MGSQSNIPHNTLGAGGGEDQSHRLVVFQTVRSTAVHLVMANRDTIIFNIGTLPDGSDKILQIQKNTDKISCAVG